MRMERGSRRGIVERGKKKFGGKDQSDVECTANSLLNFVSLQALLCDLGW